MQERLFQMPEDGICAERFGPDGALLSSYGGKALGGVIALCPAENRVYLGVAGENKIQWVRI